MSNNNNDENKITVSLPESPPKTGPIIRKPAPFFSRPIFNPLLEIDLTNYSKEEAFLLGFINGQNNRGR